MAQERIGYYGKFTPTSLDTSGADKMRALAGLGATVADTALAIGKPIAVQRGAEKGVKAAEEARTVDAAGNITYAPVKEKVFGFGADAQNQAAAAKTAELKRNDEAVYRSNVSAQSTQILSTFATEYKDDPVMFQQAANNYISGTLGAIKDPVLAADMNDFLTRSAFSSQQRIQSAYEVKKTNENIVTIGDNIDAGIREANRLARAGDAEGAATQLQVVNADQNSLAAISPKFAAQLADSQRQVKNGLYENKITGELDRLAETDGISAAFSRLDELQGKVPKGYDPAEWDAFVSDTQTSLGRTKSRVESAQAAATKEAKEQAENYITAVSAGFVVDNEATAAVIAGVEGTEFEDRVQKAQEVAKYSLSTAEERAALQASADKLGLNGVDILMEMKKADDFINRAVQADAYGFAVRQGIVEEVEFDPLLLQDDPNTPEDEYIQNQANFQKRIQQSAVLSEQYGYAISPLSTPEARMLTDILPSLDHKQKISLAGIFKDTRGVWGQIAKEGAGSFAQLSALGNEQVMNIAFKGQDEVAAGRVKPIKRDDYRKDFVEATGNVYGADDSDTVMQAAVDYYYGSVELGSDVYDSGKFKEAIQAVTGGIEKVRGVITQLPEGIEASDLEMYFDNMTAEDLLKAGLKSTVAEEDVIGGSFLFPFVTREAETVNKTLEAVHNGTIKAVSGENTYIITDPDTGFAIFKPDGITPFKFTIKQSDISKMQAKRNALINRYARSGISGAGVPITNVRP
jgi:hypothetical protein